MVIRIARSTPLLWRGPADVQLGSSAKAIKLQSLSEAEQRLLRLLQLGIHEPDFARVSADIGVEPRASRSILEAVRPSLEKGHPDAHEAELSREFVESAIAEIARANLKHHIDGVEVLRRRSQSQVFVETLDRVGLMLARALAAAGVGSLVSTDTQRVAITDVAADGYPSRARFASRAEAAEMIVSQGFSPTKTRLVKPHPAVLGKSRVAVLVGYGSLPPERHQSWLRMGVAHLSVVFDDQGVRVSPLIRPGGRPCLLCLDHERTDEDAAWPLLAAQLTTTSPEFADTVSRWFGVARASQRIIEYIDGFDGAMPVETGGHPRCSCALGAGGDDG